MEAERIGGALAAPSNRLSKRGLRPEVLPEVCTTSFDTKFLASSPDVRNSDSMVKELD